MVTDSQVQAGTERDEQRCGSRLSYTGRDERGRQGTAGDGYSTAPDRKAGGSIPSRPPHGVGNVGPDCGATRWTGVRIKSVSEDRRSSTPRMACTGVKTLAGVSG